MSVWGHCHDKFVRMKPNQREGISLAFNAILQHLLNIRFFFLKTDIVLSVSDIIQLFSGQVAL